MCEKKGYHLFYHFHLCMVGVQRKRGGSQTPHLRLGFVYEDSPE